MISEKLFCTGFEQMLLDGLLQQCISTVISNGLTLINKRVMIAINGPFALT